MASSRARPWLISFGVLAVVLVVGAVLAVRAFGPVYGVMLVGRPIFLGDPGPQRYAAAVLDIAERQAINGRSEEFAQARERVEREAAGVDKPAELYDRLNAALEVAGTKHSGISAPDRVEEFVASGSPAPSVTRDGGVVTAVVPAVARQDDLQGYADTLAGGLDRELSAGACGVIVDLRGNTGGDLGPMLAGLSPVLPDGTTMEWVYPAGSSPVTVDGNSVTGGGSAVTAVTTGKHEVPTAVLADARTASSGEAALLAFHGLDHARTFGTETAGYTSANIAFSMPDGAEVMITVAGDRDRTGAEYFNDPVIPDEPTAVSADAAPAAREWLTTQGCR